MSHALLSKLRSFGSARLLAAVMAVGLPAGSAWAYGDGAQRAYDDADARVRAIQYSLNHDQADMGAARLQVDQLQSARDQQLRELAAMKQGLQSQPDRSNSDLDRAMQDQGRLQTQAQSIQQNLQATKIKADQMHAEALAKFESTESFKSNFAAFDQARQELKKPTDAVLDQLAQTREFQDLVAAARAAKANAGKLREDRDADPKAVAAAEEEFVKADNQVQDLEEKTLTADATVMAGRRRVDDAQEVLRNMRDQMEQDVQHDAAFAAELDDLHKRQSALDAVMADQQKLDAQVADLRSAGDRQPQPPRVNPEALRDAEGKLISINSDLDRAQRQIAQLDARVATDQESLSDARRDRVAIEQDLDRRDAYARELPPQEPSYSAPVYSSGPGVDYCPAYASPAIDYYPAYEPGWDSGAYLSLGFGSSWYSDPYYYDARFGRSHYYDRGHGQDRNFNRSSTRGSSQGSSFSRGSRSFSGSQSGRGFSSVQSSRGFSSRGNSIRSGSVGRAQASTQRGPSYFARSGGYQSHSAQRFSTTHSQRGSSSSSSSPSRGSGSNSGGSHDSSSHSQSRSH